MATRLDRLVLLLDTGSNASVRNTAAQQIGDVQRQHPDELYNLLARVLVHLRSKSWDTRMAAGVAIEAIARNVPLWDPPPPPPQDANAITDSGFDDAVDFSFDKFDIVPLIKDGRAMLGSSGAEYELDYGKVTDPKERIALQKKRLKENLELGEGSSFVKVDFLSEADIKVETSTKSSAPAQAPLSQQMLEKGKRGIDDDDPAFAGLSAREKQAKKRRMKMDQKNQKSKGSAVKALDLSTSSTSAVKKRKSVSDGITPTAAKKIKEEDDAIPEVVAPSGAVVVEHKVKEEIGVTLGVFSSGDEWPFEGLCEQLCLDLFDPAWEMRHGAAVGLSAIMKVHGSGCGRIVGLTRDANQRRHDRWLEDAAIRILCVLALDRFADFVGDHVVVPVRETCAQTLSVLMKSCNKNICVRVIEKGLIKLIEGSAGAPANNGKALAKKNGGRENRWEVRHAGLIGLKYWMAVRQDLVGDVLVGTGSGHSDIPGTPTFHAILEGLKDADDDVRSVSSSTLLPISDKLLTLFEPNVIFRNVVTSLWNCLEELDDLTAATASVMDLLSKLVMKREIVDIMRREPSSSLKAQVPRLFPFFRHAITSVRLAVLRTVATLLDVALNDTNEYLTAPWVSIELIRLLFQNFIVEQREDVVNLSAGVWTKLCRYLAGRTDRGALLANLAVEYLPKFFSVVMTPIGISPIDVTQFYNHGRGDGGSNVSIHDKAMVEQDLNVVSEDDVLRGRLAGCTALGKLMGSIMTLEGDHAVAAQASINSLATGYIKSGWANHRVFVNTAIEEWAVWHEEMRGTDAPLAAAYPLAATLCEMLVTSLSTESGAMLLYNEILAALRRVKEACDILIKYFKDFGAVGCPALPPLYDDPPAPPLPDGSTPPPNSFGPVFTLQVADRFLKEVASQLMTRVLPGLSAKPTAANPNPPDRITFLNDRQRRVEIAMETFKTEQSRWNVCTVASAAKAVVQMGMLPPKLNPVVRALMDSVKFEASFLLQKRAVSGIGRLIEITLRTGKVGANDKVLKNLGVWLCADADWGDVASVPDAEVILSLKLAEKDRALAEREKEVAKAASAAATEDKKGKPGRKKSTTVPAGSAGVGGDTEFSALDATGMVSEMMKAQRAHVIVQRGADYAIGDICRRFGANVFMKVPKLWDMITVGVTEFSVEELSSSGKLDPAAERCKNEPAFAQTVVDALLTFKTVGPSIDTSLHPQLCGLLRPICRILRTPLAIVRHAASHAIASIAAVCTVQTMQALVENVIPLLGDSSSRVNRQGAAECVSMVVAGMEEAALLPYIVFMIVPMLGRMSDPDEGVRFVSTSVFAHLVKLVPLESGVPDPVGMDPEMVKMKAEERKFMAQLVGKTVDSFEVPKGIKADLRPYQKDGVSWLAFLNRYGLHGILCDDMGLGKTLQSICILASDHYLRAEKFAKTGSPDSAHTPSLVVCPPTLTGHWQSEILEYAGEVLRPMIYVGGPAERARHRSNISKNDVIITSYDILRNDIDELGHLDWNYCILDEGHVIKNAKTKLTKAVKSVRCMKRLILSGTPIQNNVLELWSLFDFLMPGFLGTEQQFNVRFGKPILASRDAKSSSSEQEKGALALEALHKQVLPFLMRRMKEDVLHDLPPKIIQDYYVDLSDLQKRLYEDFGKTQGSAMAKADLGTAVEGKKDAKGKGKAGTGTHVFQALQYLRKLCNHPSLVLTPKHPQYEKISKQMAADGDSIDDIKHAPKIAALRQILLDCGIGADPDATNMGVTAPHRALIFVQLREMLDHIENGLFQSHMPSVTYMRMDGGTETSLRHEMVTRFNADPSIDVFLLTTSVGGLGLNLTGADTVIFVEHDWNPMKDLQAMDRAHRIGQKRVVNVYRLIMRGTLEEKIMGLQKFKMNIASSIINADNAGIESMDTDQILDLFSVGGDQGRSVKPVAVDEGEKKVGMKEVLENLGGLWDEKQYDSLEINDFLANLKRQSVRQTDDEALTTSTSEAWAVSKGAGFEGQRSQRNSNVVMDIDSLVNSKPIGSDAAAVESVGGLAPAAERVSLSSSNNRDVPRETMHNQPPALMVSSSPPLPATRSFSHHHRSSSSGAAGSAKYKWSSGFGSSAPGPLAAATAALPAMGREGPAVDSGNQMDTSGGAGDDAGSPMATSIIVPSSQNEPTPAATATGGVVSGENAQTGSASTTTVAMASTPTIVPSSSTPILPSSALSNAPQPEVGAYSPSLLVHRQQQQRQQQMLQRPAHHHIRHRRVVSASAIHNAHEPPASTLRRSPPPSVLDSARSSPSYRSSPPLPSFRPHGTLQTVHHAHSVSAPASLLPRHIQYPATTSPSMQPSHHHHHHPYLHPSPSIQLPPVSDQGKLSARHLHKRAASYAGPAALFGSSLAQSAAAPGPAGPYHTNMSADQRASYPYFTHQQLLQQRGGLYIPPFDRAAYEAELLRQKMQGMKVEEVPAADEMIDDDDEYDDDGLEEEEEDEVVRERRNSSAMMVDVVPSNAANADPAAGPGTVKPKRKRASPHQVRVLQSVFDATAFPSTEHRQRLAHELGMTPRAVQIWFQNKRQGLKVKKEAGGDRRSTSPKPSPMIVPSSSPSESSPASSAYSLNSSARSSPSLAGSPGPANAAQLHPNLKSATSLVARMHGRGHRRSRTASSLEDMKRASTSVTQSAIAAQHLAQQQQAPWVTNPPIIPSSLARADDKEKLAASAMMTMMGEATPMAGVNQGRSEGHAQPEPRPQQQVPSQGQQLPGIKEMLRGIGSGV